MAKTYEEKLKELQQQQERVNMKIRRLKAQQTEAERRARTKRLIETGAILEKAVGETFETEAEKERLLQALYRLAPRIQEELERFDYPEIDFT